MPTDEKQRGRLVARRQVEVAPDPRRQLRVELPDGRVLEQGAEFTVKGQGRFVFAYEWRPDHAITCFGPVGSQDAMWRSFAPSRVGRIHRTTTPRKAS
jgi:hypothetical protein